MPSAARRPQSGSRPDVVVAWLQDDYGQLGRAAEMIAHNLLDHGLARKVAFVQPPQPGDPGVECRTVRGLDVYTLKGSNIHPELFARLYEDWSTLEGFQRTRGVLRLIAIKSGPADARAARIGAGQPIDR